MGQLNSDFQNKLTTDEGIICGVVARIAGRLGWSRFWCRVIAVILLVLHPLWGALVYFLLAWLMKD